MYRFYCPNASLEKSSTVQITDPKEIHHIKNVLRLKGQDQVIVFDGKGEAAVGRIVFFHKNSIDIKIESLKSPEKKTALQIVLACAIPKKAKFETIIEKCTELNVSEIIPLKTQRTILSNKGVGIERKNLRYQSVGLNAAKQSARSTIPQIHPVRQLSDALKLVDEDTVGFIPCLTGERQNLITAFENLRTPKRIIFFIGPEGDFTKEEVAMAIKAGCIPISLGETVLKVDTAAITVVACANLFFQS